MSFLSFSLRCLYACVGVAFSGIAVMAQAPSADLIADLEASIEAGEVVRIETETRLMATINFIGPIQDNVARGILSLPTPLRNVTHIELKVIQPGGAVAHTARLDSGGRWGNVLDDYKFGIEIETIGIQEGARLVMEIFQGAKAVAYAESVLPEQQIRPDFVVDNYVVSPGAETILLTYRFTNSGLQPVRVVPQVTFSNQNLKQGEVVLQKFLDAQVVGAKSELNFEHELEMPNQPGTYEALVWLLDEKRELVTGALRQIFVVEGDYGVFQSISYIEDEAGDYLSVRGSVSPSVASDLSLALVSGVSQEGESPTLLTDNLPVEVLEGQRFALQVPVEASKVVNGRLDGKAQLLLKGGVIGEIEFNFLVSPAATPIVTPRPGAAAETDEKEEEEGADPLPPEGGVWLIWGGLGLLLLLLIIGLSIWRNKRNRPRMMALLLLGLAGGAYAQSVTLLNTWYYPQAEWTYNPEATGDYENFRYARFDGSIFNPLTQEGFFQVDPDAVMVRFLNSGDYRYSQAFTFTISDNKRYQFDIPIPTDLSENDWAIELYLQYEGSWYLSAWQDIDTGDDFEIGIDKTRPQLQPFTYDGVSYVPSDQLLRPGLEAVEDEETTLLQARKSHFLDIKANQIQRDQFRAQRRAKIQERNALVNALAQEELAEANEQAGAAVSADPQAIVTQLNQVTSALNTLTRELGEPVQNSLLFQTGDLDNSGVLDPVNISPASNAPFNCAKDVASTNPNILQSTHTGCVSFFQTEINTLNPLISAKRADIRIAKSRFKNNAIGVEFVCEDSGAGCNPACNLADDECDIACSVYPLSCDRYQVQNPAGYEANCAGSPLTCSVDCTVDEAICRTSALLADVRGNFCDEDTFCDEFATRQFEACDNVGNCLDSSTEAVETDWFDPVRPDLTTMSITRNKDNIGGTETVLPLETTTGGVIVTNCDTQPSGYAAGAGTALDPYQICNFEQLDNLRNNASDNFILTSNIDASSTTTQNGGLGWLPIPNFAGEIDGQGFVIKDLFINRSASSNVGLFSQVLSSAKIQNLAVVDANITGGNRVGIFVGQWLNADNSAVMSGVYAKGVVSGGNNVGGLIGRWYNNGGLLSNSYSEALVSGTSVNVGGLVGNYVDNAGDDAGNIRNVYATGDVTGTSRAGGLVGYAVLNTLDTHVLKDAYATGNVTGTGTIGGVIGEAVLNTGVAIIENVYYAGELSSVGTMAGIANTVATINNSYFLETDTINVGVSANSGSTGSLINVYSFTDTLLKAQSSSPEALQPYFGWSQTDWNFGSVNDYPELLGSVSYNETIAGNSGSLAANDRFSFAINASDALNPDAVSHPDLFDTNACGSSSSTGFFLKEDGDAACSQRNTACALSSTLRGIQDNLLGTACGVACPTVTYEIDGAQITETYERQGDLCLPRCDYRLFDGCFPFLLIGETCENVAWLPLETSIEEGTIFTQTSNCGDTRNWVGTKPITQSIKHFLDGKDVFGVYFYDTFNDGPGFTDMALRAEFNVNEEGFTQENTVGAVAAWDIEEGYSPNGGNVLKIESTSLSGGYAAWERAGVSVTPNTDYILTYWVKTNAATNRNGAGAWPALYQNGSTILHNQYAATMTSAPDDLTWKKIEIPFTTGGGASTVDVQLRLEGENDRLAYFDDIVIMEENWRFDASQSWFTEPKGDAGDGICDYTTGDGDGDPRLGTDVRCGKDYFPEKSVVAFTSDGIWLLDAIDGIMWMSSLADPGGGWRYVFSTLLSGEPFASNGKIISGFRFDQGGGRNGAVTIGDFINDTMYSHRMSNCFTLAGYKGIGSGWSNFGCTWGTQIARNWSGFINDTLRDRNVNRNPWSNVLPPNIALANHQINALHSNIIAGTEYVAVAHDYAGLTILNKTNDTVQYIEFDGGDHNDPNFPRWDNLPGNANDYRDVHISNDGRLYYLWDSNLDSRTRLHVLDDITSLPFNGSILSGNATFDQRIQPNSASTSYPTTTLSEAAAALDVKDDRILMGSDTGFELFKGQLNGGSQHPDLAKQRVLRSFASAPLFGNVRGHWVNGVQDVSGKANDLTNQGSVSLSPVDFGADLQQFNFNDNAYLRGAPGDYAFADEVTFGAWIFTDPGIDDGGYIIAQKDVVDTEYALYRTAANQLRVEGATSHTVTDYNLEGWNFVVASFDGTTKRAYIDGVKVLEVADVIGTASGGTALDPNDLTELDEYRDNNGTNSIDQATAIEVVGNIAYVTGRNADALQAFDISDPSNIQYLDGYQDATRLDRAYDVKIKGNYAYVANNRRDSVAVINISNPNNLQYVNEVRDTSNLNGAIALDIVGNYAYVASLNDDSISVIDLTDPEDPIWRFEYDDNVRMNQPYDITIDGNYAYVAAGSSNALVILDVSNPLVAPTYVGQYQNNTFMGGARGVEVVGDFAFVTNFDRRSVAVIDVSNKSNPSFVREILDTTRLNGARSITVDGDYAYVASYNDDSVQIIDISDPATADLVGEYDPGNPNVLNGVIDIAVVDDKIFTANYGRDSLVALDIGETAIELSMKIGAGADGGDSTTLFSGAMALPFISEGTYSDQNVREVYNGTRDWFEAEVKITLQGTSDDVIGVKFGDYGSYFVATDGGGITQFDFSGRVVRTISAAPESETNVQLVSNNINAMDYRSGWLIIAYQGRGVEVVNIAPQVSEMLSLYDTAEFDPFFFY
jgi:hypothetical protein